MSNNNFGSNGDIEMTSKIIGRRNGYNSQSQEIMRSDSGKFPQKRIKGGRNQGAGMMERLVIDAARNGDVDEMESILDDGANPNVMDEKGRTALHWIVCADCTCKSCSTNYETCLRLLLTSPKTDINLQDLNGDTALHLAAEHQMQKYAEMLLAAGADVSIKNERGEEVVSTIARKLPDTMIYLLNESITVDQYEPHNEKCVLQVDFCPVVGHSDTTGAHGHSHVHGAVGRHPSNNSFSSSDALNQRWEREMKILTGILQTNHSKKLLTHPVISIFLEQKWRRVSKIFWMSLICYILWVILYTSYVIMIYLISCPCRYYSKNSRENTEDTRTTRNFLGSTESNSIRDRTREDDNPQSTTICNIKTGLNADVLIIVALTALMAIVEIVKLIITPKMYFKSLMNLIHWFLICLVFLTTIPNFAKQSVIEPWQYQAAAFTVFLAWTLILYQIARFPLLGRFVVMFGHVLKNFGLFIITYASLFIGFAIAFSVLFPGNTPFSYFFYAILKVLVMMVGEVDYQGMFYGESNEAVTGPILGHILYALFVIIVSIVLMNLLIGLTVSDIQALQKQAEFSRVSRLIVEIFHIESFIFSTNMPRPIGNILKGFISVVQPTKHSKHNSLHFTFRPNCSEDTTVPERYKIAALEIASSSYHEQRSQKCSKGLLNRSDNSRLSIASTSTSSSSSLETHSLDASTLENTRKASAAWSR